MIVRSRLRVGALSVASVALVGILAACGSGTAAEQAESAGPALVVYSGRSEELVAPLIESFEQESGIDVDVRYGSTAEMAAQLLEEGDGSPADLYFSQDAGALQSLEDAGLLAALSTESLDKVDPAYRSGTGAWVGTSGRARVLNYSTDLVPTSALPTSVLQLTDPAWKDQVAWAPTNASFQSFVTAMRLSQGEEATETWLTDMVANGTTSYESNSEIRDAVDAGTIKLGLSNHYYLYEKTAEVGSDAVTVANHFFAAGDAGSLVNVAGVGILASSERAADTQKLVDYLLSPSGQTYFAEKTFEYPLVEGVPTAEGLRPLDEVVGPAIDLGQLSDLVATQEMLARVGLI